MYFITGLPKSKSYEAILVFGDVLSKYSHFIPIKHLYTTRLLAEVFTREVVRLHDIPASILNDRDLIFVSSFWKELFKLQGTQLQMSIIYHPQTILVFGDGLSKYNHFIPIKHLYTTRLLAKILTRDVVRLHDIPASILNDRDPIFVSSFWKELFKLQGTQLQMSILYHPQTDGQMEVEAVQRELQDKDEAIKQLKYQL
uniref:Uncharacterized protein LOC113786664 n=1 Tax=Cicer arietinum TaxID=3827 RepID=A0A3Q7Y081_CICAR|nr:uncharacterized protein LOC113786664 [Cicer arietinum]